MTKKMIIVLCCLLLPACITIKTQIKPLAGGGYEIVGKRNALIVVKNKSTGEQFMIDNRGKPWYLELVLASIIGDSKKTVHIELDELDAVREDN